MMNDEEKQKSEARSQEPEEKKRKSVNVVSALYSEFWILASEFCSLVSALYSDS
jgi:uncharacterized membrane protein